MIRLKYEAWKVDVLQKVVLRLKELLSLERSWETKVRNPEHLNRYYSKGIYKKDQIFKFTI